MNELVQENVVSENSGVLGAAAAHELLDAHRINTLDPTRREIPELDTGFEDEGEVFQYFPEDEEDQD